MNSTISVVLFNEIKTLMDKIFKKMTNCIEYFSKCKIWNKYAENQQQKKTSKLVFIGKIKLYI